jgi:hypothetical protein
MFQIITHEHLETIAIAMGWGGRVGAQLARRRHLINTHTCVCVGGCVCVSTNPHNTCSCPCTTKNNGQRKQ